MSEDLSLTLHPSLEEIGQEVWDACAAPETTDGGRPFDPFTTYRFLKALEESGSVGGDSGWDPHYVALSKGDMAIACAPLYLKYHSQGEYIFDHSWAHAYESAGGRYYPKFQVAVPFTPVTGRRLLVRPGFEDEGRAGLLQGIAQIADRANISGIHMTFCQADEARSAQAYGYMPRTTQQYHWQNQGFADFEGFLELLSSRKRKTIRKERQKANGFGGTVEMLSGDQIRPHHWDAMWQFYQDTGARKWGRPYLTRAFFDLAHEHLRDDILLVMAEREGRYVAGAMNLIGRDTLYGRYWGCVEDHPCLHFELCYYRAIEFAIDQGLGTVEAGAQGEHKVARGYLPVPTYSAHWIADPRFAQAIEHYLDEERSAVADDMQTMSTYAPFKQIDSEEHD